MRFHYRCRRAAFVAALLMVAAFQPAPPTNVTVQAPNPTGNVYYASPTGSGTTCSFELPCSANAAVTKTISGSTVLLMPGTYRLPSKLEEGTVNTTWIGMGASPADVRIMMGRSTTAEGWTITKTAGRTNVYQFSPGVQVFSIYELGRETDLNRRIPPKGVGHSKPGEPDGVNPYYAWHDKQGSAASFFGTDFCSPTACEPQTLSDMLDVIDAVEGGWAQASSATSEPWGTDNIVYFHPFQQRDGTAINLNVVTTNDAPCQFMTDNTTIRNLSCWGNANGGDGNLPGAVAMSVGGDGTSVANVHIYGGPLTVVSTFGLENFHLSNFLALQGVSASGSGNYGGVVIEDGEIIGWTTIFNWSGPWGTAASPMMFRRLVIHDSESHRFKDTGDYDWATDTTQSAAAGAVNGYRGTHGWEMEPAAANIIIDNNVLYFTSDALRVKCSTNCVIRNNFVRTQIDFSFGTEVSALDSITLWNNVVWGQDGNTAPGGSDNTLLCERVDCGEIASSGNNWYIDDDAGGSSAETFWTNADDTEHTLTQMQALGFETNSTVVQQNTTTTNAYWTDPAINWGSGTGGDDYRLKTGSALIDAGDNTNCAHAASIQNSTCDIGPYEFGAESATGPWPAPRMFGETVTPGG